MAGFGVTPHGRFCTDPRGTSLSSSSREITLLGFLMKYASVLNSECELPDYVNWRKKTKVPCIFLRSRANIVRAISRTLAICGMNPGLAEAGDSDVRARGEPAFRGTGR